MRDLHNNIKVVDVVSPAVYSDDNTPVTIDRQGFESVEIIFSVGVGGITFTGTNKIEMKLTDSPDDSTYTAVTADDLLGVDTVGAGGIVESFVAAHAAATVHKVGYVGGERYIQLLADFGGTHAAGTAISAVAVLSNPASAPVA